MPAVPYPAFLLVVMLKVASVAALTCYDNDDDGNVQLVDNKEWTYCALIPSHPDSKGNVRPAQTFGLSSANDFTDGYDVAFHQKMPIHKVLSICLLEKYDFNQLVRHSRKSQPIEFLFRCVCNTDGCNNPYDFSGFLPQAVNPAAFSNQRS
ncbi:hypothetical protein AAVH_14221 [Aphelenchoides avenae]|nr:hypothetical protein AAVH_14221 [Aphelenchus avenae]